MKKSVKTILLLLFLVILFALIFQITSKIIHKNKVSKNIQTIPEFSFQNLDQGIFTNKGLKKSTSTVFIYFNTECEFCNSETQMIKKNIEKFNQTQLIFISFEKPYKIKEFAKKHHLNNYPNVYFLWDQKLNFTSTFDVSGLPTIVIYDKNDQLIDKIKGQTKIALILKKLNQ